MLLLAAFVGVPLIGMVSLVATGLIVIMLGLPETSLGPVFLGSIIVTIAYIYYASNRETKNYVEDFSKQQNEIDINRKKRLLIEKATDFCDSRQNIEKQVMQAIRQQEEIKKEREELNNSVTNSVKVSFSKMSYCKHICQ